MKRANASNFFPENLSPENPSGTKTAHILDNQGCKKQPAGVDVATELVAIKANLGNSEAPRGVDEMNTLNHMAD